MGWGGGRRVEDAEVVNIDWNSLSTRVNMYHGNVLILIGKTYLLLFYVLASRDMVFLPPPPTPPTYLPFPRATRLIKLQLLDCGAICLPPLRWLVVRLRSPQGEVVAEELHDEGGVLVGPAKYMSVERSNTWRESGALVCTVC